MARPRVPHHLKPVPTTISLAVHHRRWMDEGGLSPSAVVNRLLDTHRADIEADREHRRAIEKVERAIHVLKERDEEAEALAMSFVSDPENVPASRLAAMLLARVQAGEDAGPAGTILLDALSAPEAAPEAPEPVEDAPSPAKTRRALKKACCARWPECTRPKDRRRKDGLCSRCAAREA